MAGVPLVLGPQPAVEVDLGRQTELGTLLSALDLTEGRAAALRAFFCQVYGRSICGL
jgi:hypothetical protein